MDGEKELKLNGRSKDSVFVDLFRDRQNVYRLYKELYPEDTHTTAEDIRVGTLQSVLVTAIYNDLGFFVKCDGIDKYIILVEAQSVWNNNMTLRILFYLAETYRRYLADTGQSEHMTKRVRLPIPELYVVYTGDRKDVPEEVSFNEVYFDGKAPVDLRIGILKNVDTTLCGQYIGFCKVFDEQRKIHKNGVGCAEETIRICIEKGYLSEYLKARKKEVIGMMSELFDEKYLREQYDRAVRIESRAEGMAKGMAEGKADEKIRTVQRMLSINKFSLDEIAAISALTIEQVRKIAEDNKPVRT